MSTDAMTTDATLQLRVREALAAALGERATTIGVAVRRGVATLTGVAAECRDKFAAAARAGAVTGVLGVSDQVEVLDPATQRCGDDDTARACASALVAGRAVPCGGVHLMQHALVRLARAAARRLDTEAAERAAAEAAVIPESAAATRRGSNP